MRQTFTLKTALALAVLTLPCGAYAHTPAEQTTAPAEIETTAMKSTAETTPETTDETNSSCKHPFEVHAKADFVSDYIWRGAYQGSGISVQPSLTLGIAGFSLNVWGNQSLSKSAKEFDINLGYSYKNFSITVSDYWWSGEDQPYGDYRNHHYFEGTLAYNFGEKVPLSLSWSTMFAGGDKNADGHLQASTYIQAAYTVSLPAGISLVPSIGFTPWKGIYHDKAAITDIALKASKDIQIGRHFTLPIFVQAIVSPVYDRTYLVGGIGFGF